MNVLDLFAGVGGWSAAFRERGHHVTTLDLERRFGADHVRDILTVADLAELERAGRFDVVLASPPCEGFSVAAMGKNWLRSADGTIAGPKHERAALAIRIAAHTFRLIDEYAARGPLRAVVENPIGAMRVTVTAPERFVLRPTWQCQWGETRAKPTDLWTLDYFGQLPMCRSGASDHVSAPRGSRTPGSTQGERSTAERARIPYALSLAFCLAAERGDGNVTAPTLIDRMA